MTSIEERIKNFPDHLQNLPIARLIAEGQERDVVELLLQDGYYIGRGLGDVNLEIRDCKDIPEHKRHEWRGPIHSIVAYYTEWETRELRGRDSIYVDPTILPVQSTQFHKPRLGSGHLIEVPLFAVKAYEILRKRQE